jgi:hypothetical protein
LDSINRDTKLSEADKRGVNNFILAADGLGNRDGNVTLAELKDAVNGSVAAERSKDSLLNSALGWARDPENDPRYLRIAELHMRMLPPVTDPDGDTQIAQSRVIKLPPGRDWSTTPNSDGKVRDSGRSTYGSPGRGMDGKVYKAPDPDQI